MISKRLEDIGEVELDSLIANGVPEGKTIEYKKFYPVTSTATKRSFLLTSHRLLIPLVVI